MTKAKNSKSHDPREEKTESASAETDQPEASGGNEEDRPYGEAADAANEAREEPEERPDGELTALRDRHLRLAAEFDNYRKRTDRERTESWVRAQAQLVERLLDPLDDLQRVLQADPEKTEASSLLEGAEMVERKLRKALESAGLEPLEAEGKPFDPEVHEALMTVPAENREEDGTVADVFQTGYRFRGVLLRPARVRVRKYDG